MPSAFISYRRIPSAMLATLIANELKKHGVEPYLDVRQADGGGPFPERLLGAIEKQDVFVCLVADSTFDSEWVRREVEHAHVMGKRMIPIFQESYKSLKAYPTPHIEALLGYDGIHVFDVRNILIEESIESLAKMIKQRPATLEPSTRVSRRFWFFGAALGVFAIVMLLIASGIIKLTAPTLDERSQSMTLVAQNQIDAFEADRTVTFAAIMTSFITETSFALNAFSTATSDVYTDTPPASPTPSNTPTDDYTITANAQGTLDAQTTLNIPTNTPLPTAIPTYTAAPTATLTSTLTVTSNSAATQTAEARQLQQARQDAQATQNAQATSTLHFELLTAQAVVNRSNRILTADCTPVFDDVFTGGISENDWYQERTPGLQSIEQYVDGFYQLRLNYLPNGSSQLVSWGSLRGYDFRNGRVEAVIVASQFSDARKRTGIWLRYQDENHFIAFMIRGDGRFYVGKFEEDNYVDIVPWTQSDALVTGDNIQNTLRIDIEEDQFDLFINGIFVTSFTDDTWADGRLAFMGGSDKTPASFYLDYLRICEL